MIENKIIDILDDQTKSIGWMKTAEALNMTVSQLKGILRRRDACFEQLLEIVRATRSPILLREILNRLGLGGVSESRQQNPQVTRH